MKDEELARYRALNRICHIDRHGTIEGVEIDFRHELLNPSEWQMLLIGTHVSLYRSKYEPFIWFPWFGDFDKGALRAEIVADELKHGRKGPSKTSVDASLRDLTPECFVYAGDRIDIDEVESIGIGSETNNSTVPRKIESARQRYLARGSCARRTHCSNFSPNFRRARLSPDRLPVYAAIDPAILAALVGATLPPVARLIEGAVS